MEILIIGAGAMGSLFGERLCKVAAVTFLTTTPDHQAVISREGLQVTGMDGTVRRADVRVISNPEQYDRQAGLILVCTKARATGVAARAALPLLAPDGLMLTLQNGLGNLEQIVDVVGPSRAAAGTTAQAATLMTPGHVRHAGTGPTVLASAPGLSGKIEAVAELFNRAEIDTRVVGDVDSLLWSKLIVNVGINALAALLRVPNGVLAGIPECELLMTEAVAEAVAVARAVGVNLNGEEQLDRVRQVCARTSANRASMLQDILRGAPTEVDVINGAVVAKGRETGVPTPLNQFLVQCIKALEATSVHRL